MDSKLLKRLEMLEEHAPPPNRMMVVRWADGREIRKPIMELYQEAAQLGELSFEEIPVYCEPEGDPGSGLFRAIIRAFYGITSEFIKAHPDHPVVIEGQEYEEKYK